MNATETQSRIAAALQRDEPLSAAECLELIRELVPALAEVDAQIARTRPAGPREAIGADRQKALTRGTAEDLARVEADHAQAATLQAQLQAQREALAQRRQIAQHQEAKASIPGLHRDLVARLDEAEAARAAFEAALASVKDAAHGIHAAAAVLRQAGDEPSQGAAPDTLRRLADLDAAYELRNPLVSLPRRTDWASLVGRVQADTQEGTQWAA